MKSAALTLSALCLSAPLLADQPGGTLTGSLGDAPAAWRIDAERSEYHFQSGGKGSLWILAEPQQVPPGIGSIRLMVMVADETTSLLELRVEDNYGNPVLGLSSVAGGKAVFDIDYNSDGVLLFTGRIEADLEDHPSSTRSSGERHILVLAADGGRITAGGH